MRISGFSTSSSEPCIKLPKRGFTLIEILITMSILGILCGILVGYASESSRQTSAMIMRERIIQLFVRARSVSTSTYSDNASSQGTSSVCAYGLHVDRPSGEVFVFEDVANDCSTSDYQYTTGSGSQDVRLSSYLDSYTIDLNNVKFLSDSTANLTDVVFVPPNPDIYINGDATGKITRAGIDLQPLDGSGSPTGSPIIISINNGGQITWK